ncbi:MAG: MmcB family DNA repair protein [Pseudomonadota bacterium]
MFRAMTQGQLLARGVCRHFHSLDIACLTEVVPSRGLRVDVMALDAKGAVWIVECKSSRADFRADRKWRGYLPWCDRYFWAVDADFPEHLLPDESGLIRADGYGAAILREGPHQPLAAARRKALTLRFARAAAFRAARALDLTGDL